MAPPYRQGRPTLGVLAGWQFFRTPTNLSYLLPVFKGIDRAAQDLGCNLLFGCGMGATASPEDPNRPAWPQFSSDEDFVPIGDWNTDGLLIFNPLHAAHRSQYIQSLIASGHPVHFIGTGENGPTIAADNAAGIREGMQHLARHGHTRIAFIAGSPDDLSGDTGERMEAYRAAVRSLGLAQDEQLVRFGRHVFDGGRSAAREMLEAGVRFSAILASNDESALGALRAVQEVGLSVPGDVAVLGFDNRLEGAANRPALSSIHVPLFNIGYLSVERLLDHIAGRPVQNQKIRVPIRLIARESCGCGAPVERSPSSGLEAVVNAVLNQAQSLEDKECLGLARRLKDSFPAALSEESPAVFVTALEDVLHRTVRAGEDPQIWQEALTILHRQQRAALEEAPALAQAADRLLDQARRVIGDASFTEHRRYVSQQRSIASQLSLLTARLLTALDETQIYAILSHHLRAMQIPLALVVLFEAGPDGQPTQALLRDALAAERALVRFSSRDFPPPETFPAGQPFRVLLIPMMDQVGQLGYMVFGAEHFDLYGAIVQQVGGALNTARLYRQATEGRAIAEEANRMKSRFLSAISHELRTPLNLIVGLSGLVLESEAENRAPLPEAAQKDLERIHMVSQHLGGLIGDVLDLATAQAGLLKLNRDLIELGPVLSVIAQSGAQMAAEKGLSWQASLPESGPWVWGDPTRLRQVALNLINNAIKFTEQGQVSLSLESGPHAVTVRVRDTGLGISTGEQAVIFDEFRQSERSVALGYGGMGLGLAISKRIVEMHGGSIGVESSGKVGEGSVFSFTLPVIHPLEDRSGALKTLNGEEQSVWILTNRPEQVLPISAQLRRRGIAVREVELDPAGAWQAPLMTSLPDMLLVDVSDSPDPGWDVLKSVKSSRVAREIPVLFIQSTPETSALLELDYLAKPIEPAELKRALEKQKIMADIPQPARSILVVDDDLNTLEMHARVAQSFDPAGRVLRARSGREALDVLEYEPVDLVLLDLQMPEMDGFTVLERMREQDRLRLTPVIVVTGKVLGEEDMARLNRGVATVLQKGLFSIEETVAHIRSALERKRRLSSEAQRLVRKAMAFIHAHYAEPLSRREIAQQVNISEDHLTFCFRQELAATPIEYLQRYRILQAKQLLKSSGRSITEISMEVGFSDSGYFSRIFRRITGMTPEAFRRGS